MFCTLILTYQRSFHIGTQKATTICLPLVDIYVISGMAKDAAVNTHMYLQFGHRQIWDFIPNTELLGPRMHAILIQVDSAKLFPRWCEASMHSQRLSMRYLLPPGENQDVIPPMDFC